VHRSSEQDLKAARVKSSSLGAVGRQRIRCQLTAHAPALLQRVLPKTYSTLHASQWDGRESVDSYLRTLRRCYAAYCERFEAVAAAAGKAGKAGRFSLERLDYAVFHVPFNRMARKAIATLADADRRR